MKLKKNSWHYKLNESFDDYGGDFDVDFCSYFWKTVQRLFLITILIISFLSFIGLLLYKWYISIPAILIILLSSFIGKKVGTYAKHNKIQEHLSNRSVGFFKASWIKFKNKTCHRIHWE